MSFGISVTCPGCGTKVPLGLENAWVLLDKPYCSPECANEHALGWENVDTALDCPVCGGRSVETGRTGKRRCRSDHVWEGRDGVPMYLRDLSPAEVSYLREQGLHD